MSAVDDQSPDHSRSRTRPLRGGPLRSGALLGRAGWLRIRQAAAGNESGREVGSHRCSLAGGRERLDCATQVPVRRAARLKIRRATMRRVMNKRLLSASIAAAVVGLALVGYWQSGKTVFTYSVPPELVGSTVFLDGRRIGVADQSVLEFKVTKARHSLRLERPGHQPVLIQVDLSGHPSSSFPRN